jgi:tRNA A58 N-methylase Trm61
MTRYRHSRSTHGLLLVTLLVPAVAFAQRSGSTISNDAIFAAAGVREGATVCEIGAGDGALSIAAARVVGTGGRIHTSELGEGRVKTLQDKAAESGLAQITVVAGEEGKTNFPDGACDALFMRNVYHHFADPAAMNASIWAAVKPGGRVAIVDFTPPREEAGRSADRGKDGMHGVSPESVSREMKDAGFEPVSSELGTQRWFMVVVSKPLTAKDGSSARRRGVPRIFLLGSQ